ncbi:DUF5685 family protein [Aminipila terrae]|uniref:Uncharacterized protein n=1 Tax=Aminipila terrae TaxID=2697030 RepID=A0A6P1MD72_9FIRM|nr:DUF5685 family protein [Aminipila terrae]QHI71857.1 hypothetical protein Ami3637_05160 [Aminipila terrae]
MLGYVVPDKGELKMREYEVYSAYYCGICKSIGRRYGQLPRITLSYDFVFLAVLLAALEREKDDIAKEHCIIHHIKRKPIVKENRAIEYAGDVMLILAYYKLMDDYYDDHSYKAKLAATGLVPTIRKIQSHKGKLCRLTEENLKLLSQLEQDKCPELDRVEEPFAQIMLEIFKNGGQNSESDESRIKLLSHIGYHLGKWIYLMDAYEDVEENIKKDTFNPLLYRFEYEKTKESVQEFKKRIKTVVEFNLIHYLSEIGNAADLLDIKKNKGIIENIVYLGLRRRTEQALADIEDTETNEEEEK